VTCANTAWPVGFELTTCGFEMNRLPTPSQCAKKCAIWPFSGTAREGMKADPKPLTSTNAKWAPSGSNRRPRIKSLLASRSPGPRRFNWLDEGPGQDGYVVSVKPNNKAGDHRVREQSVSNGRQASWHRPVGVVWTGFEPAASSSRMWMRRAVLHQRDVNRCGGYTHLSTTVTIVCHLGC